MAAEALTQEERLDELERWKIDMEKRFADAFPGGDHVGHCRYHTLMVEEIDAKKRLRAAILEKTIAGLVWGTIVGIGAALWYGGIAYLKSLKGGG